MFQSLTFSPTFLRYAETGWRCLRHVLLIAGVVFLFGSAQLLSGNDQLREWLRPLLMLPGVSLAVPDDEVDDAPDAANDRLSPRMQAALDYAARRYRVSAEALRPIFAVAEESAREWRLDPMLIVAVIAVESRFNPLSESVMGAQGLMQVIPRFHKDKLPAEASRAALLDPLLNVRVGARALHEYIRRQGGVAAGLQQFAGAADDADQGYAARVLAEKDRMETAARRRAGSEG